MEYTKNKEGVFMTVILCVDDKNGMMFGKKRQSRDEALCERVMTHVADGRLWMSTYSAALFAGRDVVADDAYADRLGQNDVCFAEDGAIPLDKADKLILYRWNRRYPATRYFDQNPIEQGFSFTSSEDFVGTSHERITEEIYTRV